jgi:hypothetical protein
MRLLDSLLTAFLLTLTLAPDAAAQTIHLRLHAVRVSNDDGSRPADITPVQVATWVSEANAILTRSGAGIRLHFTADQAGPDWQEVQSTTLNRLSSEDQASWADANAFAAQRPSKLVVFFRHGRESAPTGNGFAFPPQSKLGVHFIAMPGFNHTGVPVDAFSGPFVQNRVIFAHELGHYLGLGHTFPGWSDTETDTDQEIVARIQKAGGKMSALDGDSLSDTPAEAGTAYYKNRGWKMCSGPASYTIIGYAGKQFTFVFAPMRSNIMSYFVCGSMRFTSAQVLRMRQTLALPLRNAIVSWHPPAYDLVTKPAPEAVAGSPILPATPIHVDSADQSKAPPTVTTERRPPPPPPPPPPARAKPVPGR